VHFKVKNLLIRAFHDTNALTALSAQGFANHRGPYGSTSFDMVGSHSLEYCHVYTDPI
jgi:hypothetical protein